MFVWDKQGHDEYKLAPVRTLNEGQRKVRMPFIRSASLKNNAYPNYKCLEEQPFANLPS